MNLNLLSDNFEMLADAPDGVPKLREMILQLAVRGKLVAQNPDDEPASALLEKIKAEKRQLIKEKAIRKTKSLPRITISELPFKLPDQWEWVRLGAVGFTQTGTTPSKSNPAFFGQYIPFIKPGDISENHINYYNEGLSKEGLIKGRLIDKDSIVMVCIGGSIGKTNFVDRSCSCNQQINTLTPFLNISHKLLAYFMRSRYFQEEVFKRAPKTTLPILSKGKWELIPIALPPSDEQKRIVTKVDQLMSLCDELEIRKQKRDKIHIALNDAALDKLLSAKTPKTFTKHWQRIRRNFDLLYDNPENVSKLRQAILQLAVQGKLVPQNPDDEPASVLLEKIKAEKERLIKAKKIRKMKPFASIKKD
ncbi:restriction endonuclease subunit S [Desulfococcaceae bacterium HSG7]|nr:restriction endonuclease subunit S [Desulfococcaceae bacterium HSG7]